MNTSLPPSRDLPPGRHVEIRTAVLEATTPDRSRRWVAPLVTATAALAVIGLVAWFAPWSSGGGVSPAAQPPATTSAPPAPTPSTREGGESVDGLAPDKVAAIEKGCGNVTFRQATFTLLAVLTDEAGQLALLKGVDGGGTEYLVECSLDFTLAMPYIGSGGGLSDFRPPLSVDSSGASSGGDAPGGKAEYAGQHGSEVVLGRVSAEVAKVTVTQGGQTVEARIAHGAYIARIVHPTDWNIPENQPTPVVRAYDKNGTLLAKIGH